jgi:hypothetical protein
MQVFVKYEVQDTVADRKEIMHIRQIIGRQLQQIFESSKVQANGVFADVRGGFFVLDVDSSEEIFVMLAPGLDYVRLEIHPLTSVEKLREFFERDAAAG